MPLLCNTLQAAKRAAEKLAHAKAKADNGARPDPELFEQQQQQQQAQQPDSLLVYQPMGQLVRASCCGPIAYVLARVRLSL